MNQSAITPWGGLQPAKGFSPLPELHMTLDFLGDLKRTHTCGQLTAANAGAGVVLMGWVHRRRDFGGVIFIHLRDREGVTPGVFRLGSRSA